MNDLIMSLLICGAIFALVGGLCVAASRPSGRRRR
jgi:hypothetical protein